MSTRPMTILPGPSNSSSGEQSTRRVSARQKGGSASLASNGSKSGDNSFGTSTDSRIRFHAPGNAQFGIIEVEQNGLRLKAPKLGFPASLFVDGHPAKEQAIVVDGPNPTKFTDGTLAFFVIRRGDEVALRVKDSQAPTRVEFHGTLQTHATESRPNGFLFPNPST